MIRTTSLFGIAIVLLLFMASVIFAADAQPQKVKIGIYLLNLGKFDVATGSYTADFYLNYKCDNSAAECEPNFEFMNGRASSTDKVLDTPNEKTYRIQAVLADNVDLKDFPFDSHRLSINIEDKNRTERELIYESDPANSGIDPRVVIVGWNLNGWDATVTQHTYETFGETYSHYSYGINISRITLSSILKIFVPVFFIVFIASLALLIKPESVNNRLGMSTAALISAVMFHLAATSSIPPVGYMTFVDKFMIGTYIVLLANLGSTVLLLRYTQKGQEDNAKSVYRISLYGVSGLALLIYSLLFLKII